MIKNVLIKIKGLQLGSQEQIETKLQGTYSLINGCHYISYEEKLSENNIATKNIIKISQDQVTITKKDIIDTKMVFDTKIYTNTDYHTPYGSINLEIRTKSIKVIDKPDLIEVKMEYSLLSGDLPISDNKLTIIVLPV